MWQGAPGPQRKRNQIARPASEPERQTPNRLLEAIAAVDRIMKREGKAFDEAIALVGTRPEFADRSRGEDFIGTVIFYFRKARGLELSGGKVRA